MTEVKTTTTNPYTGLENTILGLKRFVVQPQKTRKRDENGKFIPVMDEKGEQKMFNGYPIFEKDFIEDGTPEIIITDDRNNRITLNAEQFAMMCMTGMDLIRSTDWKPVHKANIETPEILDAKAKLRKMMNQ